MDYDGLNLIDTPSVVCDLVHKTRLNQNMLTNISGWNPALHRTLNDIQQTKIHRGISEAPGLTNAAGRSYSARAALYFLNVGYQGKHGPRLLTCF